MKSNKALTAPAIIQTSALSERAAIVRAAAAAATPQYHRYPLLVRFCQRVAKLVLLTLFY